MNLVQIRRRGQRHVALVDDARLQIIANYHSVYALASSAIRQGVPVASVLDATGDSLDYEQVWSGASEWSFLPPIDFPDDPYRTLVSGTGLTHLASVQRRDAMHAAVATAKETDSMRMYRWGVEGGKCSSGRAGTAPEWFYKGDGFSVRGHGEPLTVPCFGEDGGEEPEIAGVYVISDDGTPTRLGFTQGNEFSDHKLERRNYLYLAHSKLRTCSLGPELVVGGAPFGDVHGRVAVLRNGEELWSSPIRSGEANMCHSLANLEHHHFKYEQHRRPGDVHIHFFGADAFSFGSGLELGDGDVMAVSFYGFGRPLRNPVVRSSSSSDLVRVSALG